jgi:hypothetical protein
VDSNEAILWLLLQKHPQWVKRLKDCPGHAFEHTPISRDVAFERKYGDRQCFLFNKELIFPIAFLC